MRYCLFFGFVLLLSCERFLTGPASGPGLGISSQVQVEGSLQKIIFLDSQNGWVLTDSAGIYHTTDSQNWQHHELGFKTRFLDMTFISPTTGWVCGSEKTILRTTDGGQSWQQQFIKNPLDSVYQHIYFENENDGWIFTSWGDVYNTTNGGEQWQHAGGLQRPGLSFVKMWGSRGVVSQLHSTVLRTDDGGQTWFVLNVPVERAGEAFFINPDQGWLFQTLAPYS